MCSFLLCSRILQLYTYMCVYIYIYIYTHMYYIFIFIFFSTEAYYKILNILPYATQ